METISRKSDVKFCLANVIDNYRANGLSICIASLDAEILTKKVKFPLLEYCATELLTEIRESEQIDFCDEVEALGREGGNVILGKMLQGRLDEHFHQSIEKATEYIAKANAWYVCDILGERVYGVALLRHPEKTLPVIDRLSRHHKNWVKRALGAGVHYATKKGLSQEYAEILLGLLIEMADTKDKEIRQGVGWAAKTIARFHPVIISRYRDEIQNQERVANWFRLKVEIGLSRAKYGTGN